MTSFIPCSLVLKRSTVSLWIICFCIIFGGAGTVWSDRLQTLTQNAIRDAIAYGVDERSYRLFWGQLTEVEKRQIPQVTELLTVAQNWQVAIWDSIFETAKAQMVVRTDEYIKNYNELSILGEYQPSLNKAEFYLEQVAKGNPIELPANIANYFDDGTTSLVLSEEVASFIRDNVGLSTDRLKTLLSDTWPPKKTTFYYPKQRLKYHSDVRLVMRGFQSEVPNTKAWEARQTLGRDTTLELIIFDFSKARKNQFGHDIMLLGAEQMGINHFPIDKGSWLGLVYNESGLTYEVGMDTIYAVSRTIVDNQDGFTYNITISSKNNLMEASGQLQKFLLSLSRFK